MSVLATPEDRELESAERRSSSSTAPESAVPWVLNSAPSIQAGSPTDRVRPRGTGHSTAPFVCECQSFLDNVIAGLGFARRSEDGMTSAAGVADCPLSAKTGVRVP